MANRYIVHGTDETGNQTRKIIEAETAAEAGQTAANLGMTVRGVEVDAAPSAPAPAGAGFGAPGAATAQAPLGPETVVWKGTPSQWTNLKWYALSVLCLGLAIAGAVFFNPFSLIVALAPLPWVGWKFLSTKTVHFTLTTERLRIESGILARRTEEIELYRVKDTELDRSVWQRTLGLGTVHMVTSDPTTPRITLDNIKGATEVRESVRQQVERIRRMRGVRELDVADHMIA